MQVPEKYYCNKTTHRTLLQNADDPANNQISCGFLCKSNLQRVQRDVLFQNYGGLYVISGTGVYVDAVTGKAYPIQPGCVVQRMPGKRHHTLIDEGARWLEFYFCAGRAVFEMLVQLKLATDEPVFHAGESMEIFRKLLLYQALMERTGDADAPELLLEFERLLYYLNTRRTAAQQADGVALLCETLRTHCKVGHCVEALVRECGLSYETLRKQFRAALGCSLSQYQIQMRMNESKTLLLNRQLSVKEVAAELGYYDVYAFCNQFKQQVGVYPKQFVEDWGK